MIRWPPDGLINVDAERRLQLLNDGPVGDEHIAAVEHELGDELPGDEAEGDKGQEARGSTSHQRTVDEAQAKDEGAEADGDPKRAEHGAPIALPDVEQANREPQLPIVAPALPQVAKAPDPGERGVDRLHEARAFPPCLIECGLTRI